MAKITNARLQKLHEFVTANDVEDDDIIAFLKITTDELPEWIEAYKEFKEDHLVPAPEAPIEVKYREDTGVLRELEVINRKGNVVFVQDKVAKDLVTVKLRGRDVTLDVIALGKLPASTVVEPHGMTAERLIQLAELAR